MSPEGLLSTSREGMLPASGAAEEVKSYLKARSEARPMVGYRQSTYADGAEQDARWQNRGTTERRHRAERASARACGQGGGMIAATRAAVYVIGEVTREGREQCSLGKTRYNVRSRQRPW